MRPIFDPIQKTSRLSLMLLLVLAQVAILQPAQEATAAPLERPLAASDPAVSLNVPAEAFIGDSVDFTVTFDNPDPTDPGYGPLIDLIIPTNGADGAQNTNPPLDGLSWGSATYLGAAVESTVLTFPGSGSVTCVDHPYMVDNTGNPISVCGNAGDTFVALRLPFGSFTPDQPPATVGVTVNMSNLADLGAPLTVQARGGYQFGYDPLNNPSTDDPSATLSGWTNDSVTPILFTLSKEYIGPEDETATGPNFPRRYIVTAEIAPGQTLNPFNLSDVLPNNMQFTSVISASPGGASCSLPSTSTPGGTLSCDFASASGTVTMTFEYYIPLRDASGASVIDPSTGDDVSSCNNASGGGTWTPIDTRDTGNTFTENPGDCEHTLTDKSIATQKSVTVVGGGQYAPGAVLEYTIDFQVSDFFAFNNILVPDTISDGLHFDNTFTPTLQINGNTYTLGAAAFNSANYDVTCNYTGGPGPECTGDNPAANDGTTTITFDVSDEIITRGQDGRLIGGCVPPGGTGGGDPNCSAYDDGPTTGRIVFRAVIQDEFTDTYPSGDRSVDQGDVLDNDVLITGDVLSTNDASTQTGSAEDDDSDEVVTIGRGALTKELYAINGSTSFSTPVHVSPGDTVTYRLTYTLPTGDVEDLRFEDYLPLPVFHVDDPDENGAAGPAWTFDPTVSAAAPAAGVAKFGPSDTFYAYSSIVPAVASDTGNNRLDFTYGDFDGLNEQPYTVDILFTVTVSDDPFADGLPLTNQANAYEGATNSSSSTTTDIIQITLDEPVVAGITKGVAWTDNPNGVFSPTPVGPVTFNGSAATCAARLGGTINSSGLAANPVNSNLSGVDAGDTVMMAIVIENTGHNDAFDVAVQDALPSGMTYVAGSLCATDGTGAAFTWNGGTNSETLFTGGITLDDPGPTSSPAGALDPGLDSSNNVIDTGRNIAVITYLVTLDGTVQSGNILTNTATLTNYASSEGGPDYTTTDPTDDANVQVRYAGIGKTFTTEIIDTYNSQTQAVIGELVTYTLPITIPEGTLPSVTLADTLPAGLAFVDCLSVTPSSTDLTTDLTGGFSAACNDPTNPSVASPGQTITFTLGTLTNANRDNAVDETLTITFTAVVLNVTSNQAGTTLQNQATLQIDGGAGGTATVHSADLTVIEPVINTAKSVSPTTADAGDTVTFTITLTNPATDSTTAYDVTWEDIVPGTLTYLPGSLALGACTASTPLTLSDAGTPTLTGSGGLFQPGQSCTITFQATINYSAAPGQVITNTAETRWTSLSGAVSDRSTYNTDSDERTGDDGVGGALNDYASQGSASVTVNTVAPQKYLVATSEAHTGDPGDGTPRVTIGEIVRYRLVVQLPEGTSPNFQIRDYLPGGLTYLDGTARLALLSNGSPLASSEPTGSTLGLALGNGLFGIDPWVNGNDPTLVTPTFALLDPNVGSTNSLTTDPDSYGNGSDPFFKLGSLTNNDSDGDAEYVILEFNALVNNSSAGSNDAGDLRDNSFHVAINGAPTGPTSNTVTVRIAEPRLSLAKAVTTAPTDAGDTIVYTLTITAASGNDRATAFDLNLTDTFDANLTGLSVTNLTTTQTDPCVGNGAGTTAFANNGGVFAGNTLTFTATCLDPGQSITLTIAGTVTATAPTGYTIPNTANLTWTSLPGTGTTPNPTGSNTPGGSGDDNGERDGSGGQDDYTTSDSAPLPLSQPQADKLDPTPAQYTIGEQVTFNILVTLPEGVTQALQVVDNLPAGLEYVSHQVITTAAASGGLLTADYNGTLPAPTVTAPGGSGGDLTLVFGDTTTAADNVTNNNAFLVRVVAQVLNEAGNQNGTVLTNTATVSWTGGSNSDSTTITVIEPLLDIAKSADDSTWTYGQTVTFTLAVANLSANGSAATAHDVVITDTIPAGLTYVPGSITTAGGCVANDAGAPNLTWNCVSIPLETTFNLTYQVTVNAPPTPPFLAGDDTAVNTANVTWTSQAGDNNPGAGDGERDGSGDVNDYSDNDQHTGELVDYYALGNRVWLDTDNDGIQDAGEVGIDGVTINLYAADGSGNPAGPIVATTFTSGGGYYLFDYLLPGDYAAVIPYGNFSVGVLNGYKSSLSLMQANGVIGETPAPDPDTDTDQDDNGQYTALVGFEGAVISGAVTLGPSGNTEPAGETDLNGGSQGDQPDGRANMTLDFGFYRTQIGNLVYEDLNINGTYDAGTDTLLPNIQVRLYAADGTTEINVGPNGILGDNDDAPNGVLTDAGGLYQFGGLPNGDYIVRVTGPTGMISTVDTFAPADTADPDTNTDNNDNGVGTTGGLVSANLLTMQAGEVSANIVVDNATATTTDLTVDFGFSLGFALGNYVWFDTDNNGQQDAGEQPIDGVLVQLYAADVGGQPTGPVLATDTTANGGYYLFDNLFPGDYVVVIPASNFAAAAVLEGYWSSGASRADDGTLNEVAAPDPDLAASDTDDNGLRQPGGDVISPAVTLGPTANEPVGETNLEAGIGQGSHPDNQANMTVDFGFYRTEIGNLVFGDTNRNGVYDAGDTLLENVTVQLYSGDGSLLIASANTNAAGVYDFPGQPEGNYIVRVTPPAGMNSTLDTYAPADTTDPDTNTDNNDNGLGTAGGTVSSGQLTMTAAETAANITVNNADGSTTDLTVDFGFTAVYSLGNRVWFDTNNNSLIDGGEVGVDNVTVELYAADGGGNPTGAALATDTTANGGYYLFNDLYAGDYVVVIPATEFGAGGTLEGYWSSATSRADNGTNTETAAPDADTDVDSDDNGQLNLFASLPGAIASPAVTLGGAPEPLNETDLDATLPGNQQGQPDAQANMTVDFGFYKVNIGNLVYIDQNANGNYDGAGDLTQDGVTVELYSGDGATLLATTVTAGGGLYTFNDLPQGNYIVRVTAPTGTISTVDTYAPADTADPDTNTDNNDNGVGTTGGTVSSGQLTMTAAETAANITVNNADGSTTDLTVDFGFVYPYALGNRVWYDTDNDSQIDFATEIGIDGVTVDLYRNDGAGNYVYTATDTTTNGGYYLFDNLLPGEYIVALPAANFATGSVLNGYWSSATTLTAAGAITETLAPDPDDDTDSDDNGTLQTVGAFTGQVISQPITLGPAGGTEPTGESDLETGIGQGTQPDDRANMTVDFGFYRVSAGNLVYTDGNRNGNFEGGPDDTPLPGITVRLYASDGATEINVGPDGVLGTADDAPGGMTTNALGEYLFTGLPAGNYIVTTTAPTGTFSSRDDYNAADNADPNQNADNNDNGLGTASGNVSSAVFALTPGSAGALNNNLITPASGTTHNPTLDFGFTPMYALGNRVWYDTNNDRQIDAGETGINGVLVQLYAADGSGNPTGPVLANTNTANGGYYLFNNLEPGDYVIVIPASNFTGILNGYWSSGTTRNNDGILAEIAAPDPDDDTDSDDNGLRQAGGDVISVAVTLQPAPAEPLNETDLDATLPGNRQGQPDAQANMTVDFGFYTIQLGNLVWNDLDNSGLLDGAEAGIPNVDVQLWSADGTQLIDTVTTDAGGLYTFSGQPAGNYLIRIPAAEFNPGGTLRDYVSSTGGAGSPYEPAPNPDLNTTDSDDNGSETGGILGLGGYIQSGVFALTPTAEQNFDNANGSTTEFRVDFGLYNSVQANLTVTKDDGQDYYLQGGTLTYTIVVSNSGPSDVTGAVVTDNIPPQILSWEWVCLGATGGATGCDGYGPGNANFTDTVNLPQLSSITYQVNATIQAAASGTLNNTVTITPPGGVTETDPSDNSDTDSDLDAILSIDKDDGLTTVAPGSVITYTLNVQNLGTQDLTAVIVTDNLPTDVTFQSAVPTPTTAPPAGTPGGTLTWTGISLPSGGATTITVTVRVNDDAVGPTIINNVSVADDNTPGLGDTDDDIDIIATSNVKTIFGTDIDVDPDDPAHPLPPPLPTVLIGEVITYQISLDVPAGATLTNLQALDVLDHGLAFVQCVNIDGGTLTTSLPGGFADACNDPTNPTVEAEPVGNPNQADQGRRITFSLGDVTNPSATNAETLIVTYEVVVLDIADNVNGVDGLNNNVLWTWNGGSLEASAPPLEIIEPVMDISKDAAPTITPIGSTITFTIDIAHTPESRVDAYDVVVTDILPVGLAYVENSVQVTGLAPTTIAYDAATTTLTLTWDVFPLGETSTITFDAVFIGPSPVTNSANVAWTSLPIDPQPNGEPVELSDYNDYATERWYDPTDSAGINSYGTTDQITITTPDALPETGFAPNRLTLLPRQPAEKRYSGMGNTWLEIPALGLNLPITGIPLTEEGWDLTWLSNQIGYLQGTTYPGQIGTTGLTGHVTLADGTPGPFRNLNTLGWGSQVILHMDGYRYLYEVREQRTVLPRDFSVFKQDGYTWLTLITCKGYVPWLDTYNYRYAVRAVLLSVEREAGLSPLDAGE